MQSNRKPLVVLFLVLAFAAGCGSDSEPCQVADACASRCAEQCGEAGVISIACTGSACNCRCDESGTGGGGGAGGAGGEGGTSGGGGAG